MKVPARLRRLHATLLVAYVSVVALVGCVQRRLIYHPPKLAAAELRPFADARRLLPWTNAAGTRIGWKRSSDVPGTHPAVLVVHGNAGSAAGREYIFDPLQAAVPCDVFVLEYPGYADRPGEPSQESLLAAADEGLGLLAGRGPVFVVGESLGTGVACHLAGSFPDRVAGVVLLVPYDRLASPAAAHFPWLPVRWILLDRYPSDEWLPRYGGPVAVVVGTEDRVIPARFGKALHDAYQGPKRLWELAGEDHWGAANRPPAWWAEAFAFLRANPRATSRPVP